MRSRRTLVLVVASLLVAAAAFAVLSRFSPVQTTGLTFPICTQEWGSQGPALVASCVTFMQSYSPDLSPVYVSSLWWHQSYLEIAEGFAIRTYIRADGRGLEVEAIAPCSHGDQRKVHRWTILKIGAEPAKESA